MNSTVSLKELLEAGCHFGHQSQRWHPKAASYIYTKRDGIHIIDLVKTRDGLKSACDYLTKTLFEGGSVLFLGTKRQAKEIVREEAKRVVAFYVVERWPAGLLTNFEVMKKNLDHMRELRGNLASEETRAKYTKREVGLWEKELLKLDLHYGGIADLPGLPTVMIVSDVRKEAGAVKEAKKMGVVVVGIVDTNSDPTPIDYPIPANDDATGSIKIVTKYLADAIAEGKGLYEKKKTEEMKQEASRESQVPRVSQEGETKDEKRKTKSEKVTKAVKRVKKTAEKSAKKE